MRDLDQLFVLVLFQVGLIIAVSRLLGVLFRRAQQPQVIGEVVAGILLGPSFFGLVAPAWSAAVFPADTLPFLKIMSEYGIVLFMFLIGLELDPDVMHNKGRAAAAISASNIVIPFVLGTALGVLIYERFGQPEVSSVAFALFLGAAMSITAFPVLARILIERDLLRSTVGALTLTCAAVNDLVGWCVLALVVALGRAGSLSMALNTIVWVVVYIAAMWWIGRPLLRRLHALYESRGGLSQNLYAVVLILALASALMTQVIGIHAIFGGFMLGAMMPRGGGFVRAVADKTEDFVTVFFLPVYFAYTGLRTQIGLLGDSAAWLMCAGVIFVAVVGKFGGSLLAGRALDLSWRESAALGALVNTRGLMELIILNVGLDLGIITPTVFAMMVIMAVVTTVMTSPALALIYPADQLRADTEAPEVPVVIPGTSVLVPIAKAESGPRLIDLARALATAEHPRIYAVHLLRPAERGTLGGGEGAYVASPEALRPALEHAEQHEIDVHPVVRTSRVPDQDICELGRARGVEIIVMGWHKPVFDSSVLGGTIVRVMRHATSDVAVFIDKGMPERIERLLLPYAGTVHDQRALVYAARLAGVHKANLTLLHVIHPGRASRVESEARDVLETMLPEPMTGRTTFLRAIESNDPVQTVIDAAAPFDLTVLGVGSEWHVSPHVFGLRPERIATECPSSLLIVQARVEEA
jgi:Kef-type K+ transport system membrane component KefB/nucleotide-binding universal stress UspA family protein